MSAAPVVRVVPVEAVVPVTGTGPPGRLESQLSERELAQWRERPPGRRRDEWVAGRLAAKAALRGLARRTGLPPPDPVDVEVEPSRGPEDAGRPTTRLPFAVSISHSRGLAAAAAATTRVGIDVEPRARRWPATVLTQLDEVTAGLPGRRPDPATAWTCVEAVLKHRGCGLRHGVTVVGLTGVSDDGRFTWVDRPPLRRRAAGADARVGRVARVGGHTMALVWGEEHPGPGPEGDLL